MTVGFVRSMVSRKHVPHVKYISRARLCPETTESRAKHERDGFPVSRREILPQRAARHAKRHSSRTPDRGRPDNRRVLSGDTCTAGPILVIDATPWHEVLRLAGFLSRRSCRKAGSTLGTVRQRPSDTEREKILDRVEAGERHLDIAADVRCSRKTIQRLVNHGESGWPSSVFTSASRSAFDDVMRLRSGCVTARRSGRLLLVPGGGSP